MSAAADALAVGVEEDDFDVANFEAGKGLGDFEAQALDQIAGGGLADVAAGIGVAELQREAAGGGKIVAIVRTAQRLFQDVGAVFQGAGGFEERADLDVVFHTEQAREIARREQGVAGLGFGDEEADRGGAIHMLPDLRDQHHQPRRRSLFRDQAAEIDGVGCDRVECGVDGAEHRATVRRVFDRVGDVEPLADGVVELGGVQADMGMGQGEAVRDEAGRAMQRASWSPGEAAATRCRRDRAEAAGT